MSYIYDILVNYQNKLYDIFDWNKTDKIYHIKKMALVKISKEQLMDICLNKVKFDLDFVLKIGSKAIPSNLKYAFVLSDCKNAISINLDKNGVIKGYSNLLYDEELDVFERLEHVDLFDINYEIVEKNEILLETRREKATKKYLKKEVKKLIDNNHIEKLKYLYYECYDEEINEYDLSKKFNRKIEQKTNIDKLLDFLNLVSK